MIRGVSGRRRSQPLALRPATRRPHAFAAACDFARVARAAERFAAAVRAYFSGADDLSAAAAAERTRNFGEALRDLFAECPLRFAPELGAGIGSQAAQPGTWDAPALGATREHQLRWQRMSEAWASVDEAQRRLQRLWSDALRDAAAAFTDRLAQQPPIDMGAGSVQKLYDGWIDCAEDAYGRIAHSEPFCSALADLMNASSHWRREAQAEHGVFREAFGSADPQRNQFADSAAESGGESAARFGEQRIEGRSEAGRSEAGGSEEAGATQGKA